MAVPSFIATEDVKQRILKCRKDLMNRLMIGQIRAKIQNEWTPSNLSHQIEHQGIIEGLRRPKGHY